MRIVGVDPGLANLGLGAVEAEGPAVRLIASELVHTRASDAEGERLALIHDAVDAFLVATAPQALAYEGQYFGRQRDAARKVALALGVVLLVAYRRGVPAFSYGPVQVKGALVGTGRADKAQVGYMVRALLGLTASPASHHVADALALALTHWSAHRVGAAEAAAAATRRPRRDG